MQGARVLKARAYLLLTKVKNVGLGFDMTGEMKLSRNTRFLLQCLQDRAPEVLFSACFLCVLCAREFLDTLRLTLSSSGLDH